MNITRITRGAKTVVLADGSRAPMKFFNYIPAHDVIRKLGADTWRDYFTFCFERNP